MTAIGKSSIGVNNRLGPQATNSATNAGIKVGLWREVLDAPIQVSKITVHGSNQDVPCKLKAFLVHADSYGGDSKIVVAYTDERTFPGDGPKAMAWEDFTYSSPPTISSNGWIAFGLIGYQTGTGANYPFWKWAYDLDGGYASARETTNAFNYTSPPADLTGLVASLGQTEEFSIYATYTAVGGGGGGTRYAERMLRGMGMIAKDLGPKFKKKNGIFVPEYA